MAHHRMHSARFREEIPLPSRIKHHGIKNGTLSSSRKQDQTFEEEHTSPSIGKINEMVAEAEFSKNSRRHSSLTTSSTGSIQSAAIFLSNRIDKSVRSIMSSSSSLTAVSSSPGRSREDTGGKITEKRKKKKGALFACMGQDSCKNSRKSPERPSVDEAFFIERAFVVESLPQFWADKYQPTSLSGFLCHQQEVQLLQELVFLDELPHTLLKGPSGSGKRALAMALLREIYGEECWKLSHNLRYFNFQEGRPMKLSVPITCSCHHVELNVNLEQNAKYALMGLVKEMNCIYAITPENANSNIKSDCQVIVLYGVDKAEQDIQQIIKWIVDCHSQMCKLVLCCQDDIDIPESVRNLFKVIEVHPPSTLQIMEVLFHIAKKEGIHLSKNFAAMIAAKSNQNLRQAIMALEACKVFKYPFLEEQPISIGWEVIVIGIASEILSDPSNSCLISVREKFQKLIEDFVHPKLILRKIVEELLKKIEARLKRELYYWHAYYDKRLPPGTVAATKLTEFVAKFMGIYKKSFISRQYV
ncbi:replication factor C subunit 3-like isoform X2 [Prosopis cineraria]|uniref:replication factor C subunit 3-like isoform X2 n=1 Tax=Prosopis cineraria TaxID=364024 RepID=UPI0024104AB4|nr:replication factor C subunit 3-like isoform X2 [Prosopis cineraria]